MSIFIIGRRSYVGSVLVQHFAPHYSARLIGLAEFNEIRIDSRDVIINCAFSPDWYHKRIPDDLGFDGVASAIARRNGARYVMISSRSVYETRIEPPLSESEPVAPVNVYGRNKAAIELGLSRALGTRLLILRLANLFGDELIGRRTFISTALNSLVENNAVELDIAPTTRKDFVPSPFVGKAAAALIESGANGIYNIGSGIALPVGQVAKALIRGYGRGELHVTGTAIGDEFQLDVTKLHQRTGLSVSANSILLYLESVARRCRDGTTSQ